VSLPHAPKTGDIISGKYEVTQLIGEGGMALVLRATHLGLRQSVAIKVLTPQAFIIPTLVHRFEREARAVARLRGVNFARVTDVDVLPTGLPYMVMELLTGRDLGAALHERGVFPVEVAVDYVLQAAAAMGEAHALGIVHRDLKPGNLFACDLVGTERKLIKVIDFGISKTVEEETTRVTSTEAAFGTPHYMSPEQIRSVKDVDGRTDIWALGVILFELLTGRTPFDGPATSIIAAISVDPVPRPTDLRRDIPLALEEAILTALQKDPAARFPTMKAFADAIVGFGPELPITAIVTDAAAVTRSAPEIVVPSASLSDATAALLARADGSFHTGSQPAREATGGAWESIPVTAPGVMPRSATLRKALGFAFLAALPVVGVLVVVLGLLRSPPHPGMLMATATAAGGPLQPIPAQLDRAPLSAPIEVPPAPSSASAAGPRATSSATPLTRARAPKGTSASAGPAAASSAGAPPRVRANVPAVIPRKNPTRL
jgi:tRNA A-37 threonylcarbamoyl transferase component Bud32